MSLLGSWDEAKRLPEPVAVAAKSARDVALDVLTAREEFAAAGERVSEGVESRSASKVLGGLGSGLFTAGTFVFPGRAGGMVARGGTSLAARGARASALRSAAGLSDEAFDAAAAVGGPRARKFADVLVDEFDAAGVPAVERGKLLESF